MYKHTRLEDKNLIPTPSTFTTHFLGSLYCPQDNNNHGVKNIQAMTSTEGKNSNLLRTDEGFNKLKGMDFHLFYYDVTIAPINFNVTFPRELNLFY